MEHVSKSRGISGEIKRSADDFIVEEISKNGGLLKINQDFSAAQLGEKEDADGKFAKFVLQKKNWDTIRALMVVAKTVGRGVKSIGYSGMKDRISTSTQLASIYGVNASALSRVNLRDLRICGAWQSSTAASMGDLLGNHFTARICDSYASDEKIITINEELNGRIANYFGKQRFGIRGNNANIGLAIMRGDLENAVMDFLTNTKHETNEESVTARERLAQDRDFDAALKYFPMHLRNERRVISKLAANGGDYANALRSIPRGTSIMFIHAVESQIFNDELNMRIKSNDMENALLYCGLNGYGFPDIKNLTAEKMDGALPVAPLIGYNTKPEHINSYEEEIMEKMGLHVEDFKVKKMPELGMKGTERALMINYLDFNYKIEEKDAIFEFSLPAGAYATMLLEEFTKNENQNHGVE